MNQKISSEGWIRLIEIGVTSEAQIAAARAQRRSELAAISPELADITDAEFEAAFGRYRAAGDKLSDTGAALVEAGAAEKAAAAIGGTNEEDGA